MPDNTLNLPALREAVAKYEAWKANEDACESDLLDLCETLDALPALLDEVEDMRRQRDQWKEFAFKHPEVTPPVVTQEIAALRLDLASSRAQRDTAWRDIERLRSELDRAHRLGAGYGSDGEVPPWMK